MVITLPRWLGYTPTVSQRTRRVHTWKSSSKQSQKSQVKAGRTWNLNGMGFTYIHKHGSLNVPIEHHPTIRLGLRDWVGLRENLQETMVFTIK